MDRLNIFYKLSVFILISVFIMSSLSFFSAKSFEEKGLFLTISSDGQTSIEYSIMANVSLPRITVPLFGELYSDILIINGDNTLLDFEVIDRELVINTLGAEEVTIIYNLQDLVDKEEGLWTLNIESPIEFSVILPPDSIIIGLSSIPASITNVNNQYVISLDSGTQSISYSTGLVGTKEQASITIKNAELAINQAEREGLNINNALLELEKAKTFFEQGKYIDAEESALDAIGITEQIIDQNNLTSQYSLDIYWIIMVVAIIVITALIIFIVYWRLKPLVNYKKDFRKIDSSRIFEKRPNLRPEDREAIQYLVDSGGEAFESEIREYFKLPKTTIWRMIRRLQREDLIEVKKVGGQNMVRIKG